MKEEKEQEITQGDLRASLFEAFLIELIPNAEERTEFVKKHKENALKSAKELLDQRFKRG